LEQRSSRHQRIIRDLDLLGTTELGDELRETLVVLFSEHGLLPTVSPPGDVIRNAGSNDASQASHRRNRPGPGSRAKYPVRCPRNPEPQVRGTVSPEFGMVSPEPGLLIACHTRGGATKRPTKLARSRFIQGRLIGRSHGTRSIVGTVGGERQLECKSRAGERARRLHVRAAGCSVTPLKSRARDPPGRTARLPPCGAEHHHFA